MGPQLLVNANFDFVGKRNLFLGASAVLVGVSLVSLATRGLNYGVEFTGGAQLEVDFTGSAEIDAVRGAVQEAGIEGALVTTIGSAEDHAFLIRVQSSSRGGEDLGSKMKQALVAKYGEDKVTYFAFDAEARDSATARVEQTVSAEEVKAVFNQPDILGGVRVDEVRIDPESGILTITLENAARDVLAALDKRFGKGSYEASIDAIGAAVSRDLKRKAFLSIAAACVLIAVYIWLRFEANFAPGVILALIHDAVVVLGIWSLFRESFEFNLTIVAAILAIIGYSVNDTVVIYDRIRENLLKHQSKDFYWVLNRSVNETLSRTFLTSGATLLTVLSIALIGGESIAGFGWAMTFGLVSGTWSTIAVAMPATALVHELQERRGVGTPSAARQHG